MDGERHPGDGLDVHVGHVVILNWAQTRLWIYRVSQKRRMFLKIDHLFSLSIYLSIYLSICNAKVYDIFIYQSWQAVPRPGRSEANS